MKTTFRLLTKVVIGVAAGALLGTLGPSVQTASAIPSMTRTEIIARAESGLGASYTWAHESWVPNIGGGGGPDCSGYVLKCWQTPRTMLYQEEDGENATIYPRYSSYEFFNCLGPWTALADRSLLKPGDALAKNDGTSGHVVIYAGGDAWNTPIIYESPNTGLSVRRTARYLGSEFEPRRRNAVVDTGIVLDNPTAKSINGDDLGGNWKRSTNVAGYYGDNYQVHASTTTDTWARWTPRFTYSGYYTVYVRWTSASDRTTGCTVKINTPNGTYPRYVNQRINGSTWFSLGSYYFGAGYSPTAGSVSISALNANGYVVADAVMFSAD
jgi:hypothetical protein